jgi:hypothetical protein
VKNAAIALEVLGRPDHLSVVVNRARGDGLRWRRQDEDPLDPDEVAHALHHPVTTTLPDDDRVAHLAGTGTLPTQDDPDGDFTTEIRRLAAALPIAVAR